MTPTEQQLKNRDLWVNDLLTTTEDQAKGYLHVDGGYCCLGRACVVMGVPQGGTATQFDKNNERILVTHFVFDSIYPEDGDSDDYRDAELTDEWFSATFGVSESYANEMMSIGINMNDEGGHPFPAIGRAMRDLFDKYDSVTT